jgi:hypothetical protein
MIKRVINLFTGLLFLASVSNGQEIFKLNSGGGGFNVTMGYQKFGSTNFFQPGKTFDCGKRVQTRTADGAPTVVSNAIYKEPSGGMLQTGFQGFGVFNSIILGGELDFMFGTSNSGEQIDTIKAFNTIPTRTLSYGTTSRFAGGDVVLNVGFVALRKRGIIVYPMIGIGYGVTGLWLQSQSVNRTYPALTDVVTATDDNLQNMFIWTRNAVLDFGIGAQYMLGASTEDKAKGFSLGFRFGYKTQLGTNNILVNGNKKAKDSFTGQTDAFPKIGYGGPYVKFLIGFGRIGETN